MPLKKLDSARCMSSHWSAIYDPYSKIVLFGLSFPYKWITPVSILFKLFYWSFQICIEMVYELKISPPHPHTVIISCFSYLWKKKLFSFVSSLLCLRWLKADFIPDFLNFCALGVSQLCASFCRKVIIMFIFCIEVSRGWPVASLNGCVKGLRWGDK